jgi:chromosome segregation protein
MRLEELRRHIEQSGKREDDFMNFDVATTLPDSQELLALEAQIFKIRGELAHMGEVDPAIIAEAHETQTRHDFLSREAQDLQKAISDLQIIIAELREKIDSEFNLQLASINKEFSHFFQLMFGGGDATLVAIPLARKKNNSTEEESQDTSEESVIDDIGIEISISLPRKRIASLDVLSGGERSLVGIAALFALISVSPPPFLVLDEVDAPLDERNARRFAELLRSFSKKTQFIVVTHNRVTMEAADVLYGITLDSDGTSKVVSLKLQ